jgi:large subunit ribosomal protein L24
VLVEGVNRRTHHIKPGPQGTGGGIEQREAPIHVSNVAFVDPEDNKPTKIGYRVETVELEDGRSKQVRQRFAKRSGKDI